jgi:hypothetical protein
MLSIPLAALSKGLGLVLLSCWDCGFEPRRIHGCLYLPLYLVLSGRDLCVGLISRPQESYLLWCV